MIEKLHRKARIDRRLVRIRRRAVHVVQAEACEQRRLVRQLVIHANRKLVRVRHYLRRRRERPRAKRARGIVRQRVSRQNRRDLRTHRHKQRVTGRSRRFRKGGCVDPFSFVGGRHRENLRRSQHLAETRVLAKEKCLPAPVINSRQHHRPADRHAEFVAHKRRNPPRVQVACVIKEIPRIESRIAHKFKRASMQLAGPGFRHHIRESRGALPKLRRHHSGVRLYLVNRIHAEIRKRRPAELRVGRRPAIHRKHRRYAALSIHCKLLGKIRRAVGVRHRARGQQQ